VPPQGASPEATLVAVRQLLHNHPGPHASPSAVEQWHHDVDQLVIVAINMPPHGGRQLNCLGGALVPSAAHSHSPVAPRMPSAVCVVSLATMDLQAELEHCRSGEDGRITIERQQERHCNLDRDFSVVDTTPVRQAARSPTSPTGSGGGYMALAPHLCMVVWPRKFWVHLPKKYDGSVNPTEFL
jgi:hypothetical protein